MVTINSGKRKTWARNKWGSCLLVAAKQLAVAVYIGTQRNDQNQVTNEGNTNLFRGGQTFWDFLVLGRLFSGKLVRPQATCNPSPSLGTRIFLVPTPFETIFAPFESSRWPLPNGAKLVPNGVFPTAPIVENSWLNSSE